MIKDAVELEDELGDVLEKAIKYAGMTEESLARKAGVRMGKIKDAEDYRYDFLSSELRNIAAVLKLNEVGLSAIGEGRYPLPDIKTPPFEFHVLAMPFGLGSVNAYLFAAPGSEEGILFDTGAHGEAVLGKWPASIRRLKAIFLTHWDADHAGGLEAIRREHPKALVFGPDHDLRGLSVLSGSETLSLGGFRIQVLDTRGHAEKHFSYLLSPEPGSPGVFVGGDLLFAGSVACAFYSSRELLMNVRHLLAEMDENTVVAPGHGPITTVGNERRYNAFSY